MNLSQRIVAALGLGLLASSCNAIIGADEPIIIDDAPPGIDDPGDDAGDTTNTPVCGDGVVQPGEECDDGNDIAGDGCTQCIADCKGSSSACMRYVGPDQAKSWDAAEEDCKAWGGHLMAIHSTAALEPFASHMLPSLWLGGRDRSNNGEFAWENGDAWDFEVWAPGRPASSGTCVRLLPDTGQFWDDDCSAKFAYVCARGPIGL